MFCVHDADADGSLIYETFAGETRAREARKIAIVNLGLEPWEAIEMGLEIEAFEKEKDCKAVAGYVPEDWDEWLQTHRVELNAMSSPQFEAWLDSKMAEYHDGKRVRPKPSPQPIWKNVSRRRCAQH